MKKITGRSDQITLRKALMVALNKFFKDYPLEEKARLKVLATFRAKQEKEGFNFKLDGAGSDFEYEEKLLAVP